MTTREPINLFDFEPIAKGKLPPAEYDYIAGGATDEVTLNRTRGAFDAIALRPRVLTGASHADLSTTVLGQRVDFPVLLAPTGGHTRAHPDRELASARAASKAGTVMALSANSSYTLEEVAHAADGPKWLQTYIYRDRELTLSMVKRAEEAGYTAICITLDASWPSKRERNIRNGYRRNPSPNYTPKDLAKADDGSTKFDSGLSTRFLIDPGATWTDMDWLRSITKLPIVAKGILTAEDAALAAEHGIDGVIVSNHGARSLDTTLATVEALPEVAAAANGKTAVYLDGGIRRGTDVVKALAMGAQAVFVGRPIFWGLAYAGEEGVSLMLDLLRDEVFTTMMLSGQASVEGLGPDLVTRVGAAPGG